jgi:tRNA N6-adenosine threonylcarbamoyltransferase
MRVLGIESSCDETGAAVVGEDGEVYADVVQSQIKLHAPYGGVVPELASRDHMRAIAPVLREALAKAGLTLDDIDAVAVTAQPGLSGALLVGVQTAKAIAWARDLPIVAVDHLVGHLLSVFLKRDHKRVEWTGAAGASSGEPVSFPFIALLASGGHTAIYRVDGPRLADVRELGATRDDAAGEAFDKVAKLLGLGYPGGPVVDKLAAQGDAARFPIPIPMARRDSLEFSFSGVKSFVARHVAEHGRPRTEEELRDVCAGFQRAVVTSLVKKAVRAAIAEGVPGIVLGGGVAANKELRRTGAEACAKAGLRFAVPPFASCTDNAAMIAYAGAVRLREGERDELHFGTATRTALRRVTRKGGGPR